MSQEGNQPGMSASDDKFALPNIKKEMPSIKESDRKRTKEVTSRSLTPEDMADNLYAKASEGFARQAELDKEKGFDIDNMETVMSFKVGYTPIGNTVLLKVIHEEQKVGMIIIPDSTSDARKAVVVVPGLLVTVLKKGDIIAFKKGEDGKYAPTEKRIFKGITFEEISFHGIAGVFKDVEEMDERLKEMWKQYKP